MFSYNVLLRYVQSVKRFFKFKKKRNAEGRGWPITFVVQGEDLRRILEDEQRRLSLRM